MKIVYNEVLNEWNIVSFDFNLFTYTEMKEKLLKMIFHSFKSSHTQ